MPTSFKKILLCLGMIWVVSPVLWAQPNSTIRAFQADKLYLEGQQLLQQGRYHEAIDLFDQVQQLDDGHMKVYEMRAEAYYALGEYRRAIEDYEVAADQHPENAELRNSMGAAAGSLGMFEAAANYFYDALEIDPDHEAAKENLEKARRRIAENPVASRDDRTRPDRDPYDRDRYDRDRNNDSRNDDWRYDDPRDRDWRDNPRNDDLPRRNSGRDEKPKDDIVVDRAPATRSKAKTYAYNFSKKDFTIGQRSDPMFNIEQIKVTPSSTQVTFSIRGVGDENYPITLDKVGGPRALFLTDKSFTKTYRLKDIRGLHKDWAKRPYMLRPGDKKIFVAEFERLGDDVFSFHLLEGKEQHKGTWDFWEINLKR